MHKIAVSRQRSESPFYKLICGGACFLHRSWKTAAGILPALLLILNSGYWKQTVETVPLVFFATLISVVFGVPVGIVAALRRWLFTLIRPILDLMRTIPTFVYLIPTLMLFGLGMGGGLISTVIFAIPAPIRLTCLGITGVPRPLIDAGQAFGASRMQLLIKVELPHAMPTIMAGLTQCIMLSLSMVVIAACNRAVLHDLRTRRILHRAFHQQGRIDAKPIIWDDAKFSTPK